jgi:hypothetical protein
MQYGGYNLPPVVSSLIPFVGSGLSFAGGPLQYTTDAYKKVQLLLLLPLSHLFYFCILPFLYFYFILFLFVRNYYWLLMHAH